MKFPSSYLSKDPVRQREYQREWRAKNPEKVAEMRFRERLRVYGLTPETYQALLDSQGNACAICERGFGSTPHIDHCHETGKVRGVLCVDCNTSLGKLGDTVESIRKVLRYLEK